MKKFSEASRTLYACYLGYITQAIINNFAPLLFVTFRSDFSLSLSQITWITTLNFLVQLCVDLIAAKYADRIGYRRLIVAAHLFCAAGLAGLTLVKNPGTALAGLLFCVVLYAIGGGLIEVLISPIVEACPVENKEASMSLLHSFYCWGHAGVIVLSTLFFMLAGVHNWRYLALLWTIIPLLNSFFFTRVRIWPIVAEEEQKMESSALLKNRIFLLLLGIMICAGAAEQAMSQWASAFAESGLGVSKTMGDLFGPFLFAVLMGTSRALFAGNSERIPLKKYMYFSGVLCAACYLTAACSPNPVFALFGCALTGFSVGIFWPGTFSVAAKALPGAGTLMYALMALAGDIGCSLGPTMTGQLSALWNDSIQAGLLPAILFPLLLMAGLYSIDHGKQTETLK